MPVLLVIALQVPYPLVHGHARDVLTIVTVVVFAAVSFGYAVTVRGWRYAAVLASVAGAGGFAVEVLGVHTGVPFGHYHYGAGLGPKLFAVPVVIGLAWLMMAHPCVVVAERVATRAAGRVAAAAVGLAGWDVFLDPQMVDAHHWQWSDRSPHLPGIDRVPLTNLGGWLLVATVLSAALVVASPRERRRPGEQPLVVLWVWVWLSSALAALVFFGHPAVAAWGFVAMGLVGIPLLVRR
ncbi:MAG: carotenoid biosynthesis protein [Frankiaceae bacterium]|nr:carotenoid biosynthesis protein [Frankiaceae bacterium]MBV9369560.1 carotenoid biosynthesis protein [Frankiales bacterium]